MNYPIYVDESITVEVLLGLFANAGLRLRCNLKSEMVVEPRPVVPVSQ
jgi:hypothetical protein